MIWVLQINNKQDIRTFKQTTQKQKNRIDIDNHSYLCYISSVDWLNQSSPLEHRVLTQLLVNKEQLGWKILGESLLAPAPFLILFPSLTVDSSFIHWEARIHQASQNFKIYVGVATTFVSGKCSFLLKADGLSTRLRTSKLNSADIRSNKPTS